MNNKIFDSDIQKFINEHLGEDLSKLLLKGIPFQKVSAGEIVDQIKSKKKCLKKHPDWSRQEGLFFPPLVSVEQSSSEKAAHYKSTLVSGDLLVDLTAGMGMDSFYFAKSVRKVKAFEENPELAKIGRHNFSQFNALDVEFYHGDGTEELKKINEKINWIYIDPVRRDESENRLFRLRDTSPNVIKLLELYLSKSDHVMIKTSPLLDISRGLKELENVFEIHIVAIKNEVKELLWLIKSEPSSETKLTCINFKNQGEDKIEFDLQEESKAEARYGEIQQYIYEPNVSLLKAGAFQYISNLYGIDKLHKHTHLYTSNDQKKFAGRTFEVLDIIPYNKKILRKKFGSEKMHIIKRNYPESIANIRKKTGIKEGGCEYLIFTTDLNEKRIVVHCKLI